MTWVPPPADGRADDGDAHRRPRQAETIGRPLGGAAFLETVEAMIGRPVAARKRKPKAAAPR